MISLKHERRTYAVWVSQKVLSSALKNKFWKERKFTNNDTMPEQKKLLIKQDNMVLDSGAKQILQHCFLINKH